MSLAKAELKALLVQEHGVQADDLREAAVKQMAAHAGAKLALRSLGENIAGLMPMVDGDLDSGELPDEPLAVAEYAKKMITRAHVMATNASEHQRNCERSAAGEIAAYAKMVAAYAKQRDQIQASAERVKAAIESGAVVIEGEALSVATPDSKRPRGVKPAKPIKQRRNARKKKATKRGAHTR